MRCIYNNIQRTLAVASSPGSPPPLFIVHMQKATEQGESLGGFDHVRTLMTRSVSTSTSTEQCPHSMTILLYVHMSEGQCLIPLVFDHQPEP